MTKLTNKKLKSQLKVNDLTIWDATARGHKWNYIESSLNHVFHSIVDTFDNVSAQAPPMCSNTMQLHPDAIGLAPSSSCFSHSQKSQTNTHRVYELHVSKGY